ncbi:unnamed protein product [Tenebrio molitor]|nr:unnamed protein product [Tenebrio molitor]
MDYFKSRQLIYKIMVLSSIANLQAIFTCYMDRIKKK